MIAATADPTMAARLFRTPVGTASARLLRSRDLLAFTPATEGEVDQFLAAFCSGWAQRGHAGPLPDVRAVRKAMNAQDRHLLWLWSLARRSLGRRARDPQVAIAPVLSLVNPVIIGATKGPPLIVMAETLWSLVMKVVLGVLTWADGPAGMEARALNFVHRACHEWRANDPSRGPSWDEVAALSTLDQDSTTFSVGLAHGFFTWAYLHELAHFRLGHLSSGVAARSALGNPSAEGTPGLHAEVRSYAHAQELEADAYAAQGFMSLVPRELEIRTRLEFGAQIDHAPIIGFEVINLAMRLSGLRGSLDSPTHPAPWKRRAALRSAMLPATTASGRRFHRAWRTRLVGVASELGLSGVPV